MRRNYFYILTLFLFTIACEDYYTPDLDRGKNYLVVESKMTNDTSQNFVQLSGSTFFYDKKTTLPISGSKVELVSENNVSISGIEKGSGYFKFPVVPEAGTKYMLRISYDDEMYESDLVTMPPIPTLDSVYTGPQIHQTYLTNAFGAPTLITDEGIEIYVDAPISEQLGYYRFNYRTILQWMIEPEDIFEPYIYGWKSFHQRGVFNIAGQKKYSFSGKIEKHPIAFLNNNSKQLLDSAQMIARGWILILHQYGTTRESYQFHEKMNSQLEAEGKLFDPIYTQIYGNIRCITDSNKIVLGFFDLNSYRQSRYFFLRLASTGKVFQHQIDTFYDIPDTGSVVNDFPEFWETVQQ